MIESYYQVFFILNLTFHLKKPLNLTIFYSIFRKAHHELIFYIYFMIFLTFNCFQMNLTNSYLGSDHFPEFPFNNLQSPLG
jgi:hypothetical protein